MRQLISDISKSFLHYVFPQLCIHCNKSLLLEENTLCLHCLSLIPFIQYNTQVETLTTQRLSNAAIFQHAISLAYFEDNGILQHLLHELKYKQNKRIGTYLGDMLGIELVNNHPWANNIDAIIPVPIHPQKQKLRGYNQSILIANSVSKKINKPILSDVLIKVIQNKSQTKMGRLERVFNTQEVFEVQQKSLLKEKHILLIDDVLTTGSTIITCTEQLKQEPTCKVSVATIGVVI